MPACLSSERQCLLQLLRHFRRHKEQDCLGSLWLVGHREVQGDSVAEREPGKEEELAQRLRPAKAELGGVPLPRREVNKLLHAWADARQQRSGDVALRRHFLQRARLLVPQRPNIEQLHAECASQLPQAHRLDVHRWAGKAVHPVPKHVRAGQQIDVWVGRVRQPLADAHIDRLRHADGRRRAAPKRHVAEHLLDARRKRVQSAHKRAALRQVLGRFILELLHPFC
mmetsp:Transcript_40041/g.119255  ORF Transcript_40041/g.119255 Transcript_40041/m.119255 type:complete len:226 (+) Transcript_40041:936-1613(+)